MMFDHMIEDNNLLKHFREWELNDTDLIFIKEMINGCPSTNDSVTDNLHTMIIMWLSAKSPVYVREVIVLTCYLNMHVEKLIA